MLTTVNQPALIGLLHIDINSIDSKLGNTLATNKASHAGVLQECSLLGDDKSNES